MSIQPTNPHNPLDHLHAPGHHADSTWGPQDTAALLPEGPSTPKEGVKNLSPSEEVATFQALLSAVKGKKKE